MHPRSEPGPGRRRDRWLALLCMALLAVQLLGPALHRLGAHRHEALRGAALELPDARVAQSAGEPEHDEDACALCQHFVANARFTSDGPAARVDGLVLSGIATPSLPRVLGSSSERARPPARGPPTSSGC